MQEFNRKNALSFLDVRLNCHTFPRLQIRLYTLIFLFLFLSNPALLAQKSPLPEDSSLVKSMGLPQTWKPYFGPMGVWDRRGADDNLTGELNLGIYEDYTNPLFGVFGVAGEGYVSSDGTEVDGGFRLLGASRFFFLQGGLDYSIRNKELDFLMSYTTPVRRGGPLGKGGSLRIDWFPGRSHSFSFGLSIPLGQPHMGKSRPTLCRVSLPKAFGPDKPAYYPDAELREILTNLQHAADWINRFTIPFLDQRTKAKKSAIEVLAEYIKEFKNHIHLRDDLYPDGHTFEAEVNIYHQELERAFSLAAYGIEASRYNTGGSRIAGKAREILLDEVILPYNRLLGQRKEHDSVLGYGGRATEIFKSWIQKRHDIPMENQDAVMYIFQTIIEFIEENRDRSREIWDNCRLVWIPLHYALQFEDHDTENELDAIIEKAVEQKFSAANDVHYVINELFQPELARTIRSAEDYHVLWIHDIRGLNSVGEPDEISYRLVTEAYLQTLIKRIREYESTRKIPVYMIFMDQHYFEINHSRPWLALLENPMDYDVHFPPKFHEWEEEIHRFQDDLRAAIAESPTLQAGVRQHGKKWLANQIKVHVSITNPADLSFRSSDFFKYFPFMSDNIMRDHRKIVFYDVTELDPGKGEAIYTGMGIGEHYVGPTWDDRGILARGPALLALKDAARELLSSQGFNESQIPEPLRPLPKPHNYNEMLDELRAKGWTASAMELHNATGFGMKSVNIIKAVLYNLMPKGSHLYIPDSLWNGHFWGAMLIGAALRGCVVLVVSPSQANAPGTGAPQMSLANELFTRFLIVQDLLREEIESAGGLFKTGIYDMDLDVGDVVGKIRALNNGIAKSEVFQKVFPFAPSVVEMISGMPELMVSRGFAPSYMGEDTTKQKPKLHLKSQFFASERAIKTVIPLEGWEDLIRTYIIARAAQITHRETQVDTKDLREVLSKEVAALFASWSSQGLSQKERDEVFFYLTVGSHNQDYRSMIMDGEVLFVVGQLYAMVAYLDFVSLAAQTTWVDNVQQLEELLPRYGGFWKWLSRAIQEWL
jgi:hypothetical protein